MWLVDTSILWKRLLGPQILELEVATPVFRRESTGVELRSNAKIRLAAACARKTTTTGGRGGVAIAFSNPTADATLLSITVAGQPVLSTPRREWFLTSGGEDGSSPDKFLLSRVMLLNGVPLNHTSLKPGGMEGHFVPSLVTAVAEEEDQHQASLVDHGIVVRAWSYGYIVLESAAAHALCEGES